MIPEQAIWWYYNKGFSIIPLGANPRFKDKPDHLKKPSLDAWEQYHHERATREQIQQWIKEGLFVNIGVIGGHVSNNLVIIDIDDERIPEILDLNWKQILKDGGWGARTGKGYQIWVKHHSNPGGVKRPSRYSIEYRANGGYCAVPPSTHPNGNTYHFIGVDNLDDLPELQEKDVQRIFNSFKEVIGKAWKIETRSHNISGTLKTTKVDGFPPCVEQALKTETKHPDRYHTLYGICCSCYFRGLPKEETQQIADKFNREMCKPPHDQYIVDQAVNGCYKDDAHRWGCEFWIDSMDMCPFENPMECGYGKKHAMRELARKYHIFKYEEKEGKDGKKFIAKVGVNASNLAKLIINEYGFNFFTMRDTGEIFYYSDGVYKPDGETIILQLSEEYMDDQSTQHRKNEIVSHIRDYNYKDRTEITVSSNLINLDNGVFDISTFTFIDHSPKYYFVNKHPITYDEKAECPLYNAFLRNISMKEGTVREKIVYTIQEYMGYSFYREYPFKNYIILDGGGDNGKTVQMNVQLALIGEDNNTSIGLQELNERPFAKAQLYGKNTNISDDLPKKALKLTGVIKQITGNSPIWADIKNSKKGISFTPYAKPWYACNELPMTNDYTDAFFSRQLQITLLNKYLPKDDPTIDNISRFERDTDLTEKLLKELPGIFNYSMIGLKRLLENKHFTDDTSTDDKRTQWIRKTNPVAAFLEDEFEIGDNNWCVTVDDFYNEVIHYCERNEFDKPTSRKYVTEKVLDANLGIEKKQKTIDGVPHTWCWIGLKITTNTVINHNLGEEKKQADGGYF